MGNRESRPAGGTGGIVDALADHRRRTAELLARLDRRPEPAADPSVALLAQLTERLRTADHRLERLLDRLDEPATPLPLRS